MIAAFQRNEARRRDERCQLPAFFEWNALVVARMQNQRRNADAFGVRGDINLIQRLDNGCGVLRRGRCALQIIEPLVLVARPVRDKLRREDLTECWIVASPTEADELYQGLRFLSLRLRDVPPQCALGVSTKKHQAGNLFRVPRGICYGDCAALRHAEKRELLEALRLDDGLEVIDPRLERRARRRPVGQAAAPLVIANEGVISRQFLEPMRPHRTTRIVLGMAEPVRGSQERRLTAKRGHCDPCTITRFAEPDVLLEISA